MRLDNRTYDQMRYITMTPHYLPHAEGSVLVEFGGTKVICTASATPGVPPFLKGMDQGWVTAEYGMLPRATLTRSAREAAKGKQTGRTQEIQRLIARSLRSTVDLKALGEHTLIVDCDVIQADGGTRTASITGGCVALHLAIQRMCQKNLLPASPFRHLVAAVSVGIYQGEPMLDLNYEEDANAETDMNVVMTEQGDFVELQGTAEKNRFSQHELNQMLVLAKKGIMELVQIQHAVLK